MNNKLRPIEDDFFLEADEAIRQHRKALRRGKVASLCLRVAAYVGIVWVAFVLLSNLFRLLVMG
jgi:hypothetical protein